MPVDGIGTSSAVADELATVPTMAPYPSDRLDLASTAKCGTTIARFARGRNTRNATDHPTAAPTWSVPARVSWIARAITYATTRTVAITRPCDRCAVATWPHANAASASHASRRHPVRPKYPDAPVNRNGVHASVPANGRLIARIEAETAIASESPPAVAAIRPSPSFRRNQNSPSPARIGFRTIIARSPPPHPNSHDEAIVGSESHPLCGSAANQVPDISNGFHSGT